jgi:hypothetical protein
MKALLALAITLSSLSAQAWGLDSHYGKVTQRGFVYTCHYTNRTHSTLDMKYVEFSFVRVGGHGDNEFTVSKRVDTRVHPGESISHSVNPNHVQSVFYCKYLSR